MALSEGKEAAKQVWGASPAGCLYGEGAAIGTKQYFENVIQKRSNYELPWLFDVFPFGNPMQNEIGFQPVSSKPRGTFDKLLLLVL